MDGFVRRANSGGGILVRVRVYIVYGYIRGSRCDASESAGWQASSSSSNAGMQAVAEMKANVSARVYIPSACTDTQARTRHTETHRPTHKSTTDKQSYACDTRKP